MKNGDTELADEIRQAAKVLCRALNAAGEAGLNVNIEFKPHRHINDPGMATKSMDWKPFISVSRTDYV